MKSLLCISTDAENNIREFLRTNGYFAPGAEISGVMNIKQIAVCKVLYNTVNKFKKAYIRGFTNKYIDAQITKVFVSSSLSAYAMVEPHWHLIRGFNETGHLILDPTPLPKKLYFSEISNSVLWEVN